MGYFFYMANIQANNLLVRIEFRKKYKFLLSRSWEPKRSFLLLHMYNREFKRPLFALEDLPRGLDKFLVRRFLFKKQLLWHLAKINVSCLHFPYRPIRKGCFERG